jgi:hypothetical protein
MSNVPVLKPREVSRILERLGFVEARQRGSHIQYRHPDAGVAFFFKQWGGVRKSEAGRTLDGQTYDEFPERRPAPVPNLEFRRTALERLETELA